MSQRSHPGSHSVLGRICPSTQLLSVLRAIHSLTPKSRHAWGTAHRNCPQTSANWPQGWTDLPLAGDVHWFICSLRERPWVTMTVKRHLSPETGWRKQGKVCQLHPANWDLLSHSISTHTPCYHSIGLCRSGASGLLLALTAVGRQPYTCKGGERGPRMCSHCKLSQPPPSGHAPVRAQAPRAPVLFCTRSPSWDAARSHLQEPHSRGRLYGCKGLGAQMGAPPVGPEQ